MQKNKLLEWLGVITAIIYSLLVALNIGAEFIGFTPVSYTHLRAHET